MCIPIYGYYEIDGIAVAEYIKVLYFKIKIKILKVLAIILANLVLPKLNA